MARVTINCRKCGKAMKIDFSDTSTICKKCRKNIPAKEIRTTRNFDF